MPKYVIERELPVAGQLSPQQLQVVSQTSCSVLRKLGPGDSVGSQLRDPGQNLLHLHRSQRGPDAGARQPGGLPRESNLGDHVDDRSNDSRTVITWPRTPRPGTIHLQAQPAIHSHDLSSNKMRRGSKK
jgi:hypothetical protein